MKKRFTYIDPATNRIVYDALHEPYVTREEVDKIVAKRVGKHWSTILNLYQVTIRTVDDNYVLPRRSDKKQRPTHRRPYTGKKYRSKNKRYTQPRNKNVDVKIKRKVSTNKDGKETGV